MNKLCPRHRFGRCYRLSLFIFSFFILSHSINGQDFILTGGNWSVASNWAGGVIPPNPFKVSSITIAGNATLDINSLTIGVDAIFTINSGVSLDITSDGFPITFTNDGTIENNGMLNILGDENFLNNGIFNNNVGATLNNQSSFVNSTTGVLNNNGGITSGNDDEDDFGNNGSMVNNGSFFRADGTFTQGDKSSSLSGSGIFDMNGSSLDLPRGILSPGNSFGTMSITGDLILGAGVSLQIEIGGDGSNDQISISGDVSIAGTLNLIFGSGEFSSGENWTILTAGGTLSGTFNPVNFTAPSGVMPANLSATYPGSTTLITYTGATFLPVELSSFTGKVNNQTILLEWQTASEINNDYMVVERSGEGWQFSELGRVKGQGTTLEDQFYEFIDEAPLEGINYYRLRQVDFDSTEEYSNVITVDMLKNQEGLNIQVFPNPSQEFIQIEWNSSFISQNNSLHLIKASTGQVIQQIDIPRANNQLVLSLDHLPAGLYIIQMVQANFRNSVPFMKN